MNALDEVGTWVMRVIPDDRAIQVATSVHDQALQHLPSPLFSCDDEAEGLKPRDGQTIRARLQIGAKWYPISEKKPWRFHSFMKRINGQWQAEPGTQNVIDTTNTGLP